MIYFFQFYIINFKVDGRAAAKFRVRFDSPEGITNFVTVISNYVKVMGYDEWRMVNPSSSLAVSPSGDSSFSSSAMVFPK